MKMHELETNVYDIAAIMIQTQWRSFVCEMNFLRTYEDILVVQSVVRGWVTRRRIRSWLRANNIRTSRRLQGFCNNVTDSLPSEVPCIPRNESKKLSKSIPQNDLSPIYTHHIEYMRNKLTSGPVSFSSSPAGTERNRGKAIYEESRQHVQYQDAQSSFNQSVETLMAGDPELQQNPLYLVVREENEKSETETLQIEKPQTEEGAPTPRADIERRRKHKELEARAKHEEDRRRKETLAAEIAEIEFRRKRMALKAESRKREEFNIIQTKNSPDSVSLLEERFPHNEEKKIDEAAFGKDFEAMPRGTRPNSAAKIEDSQSGFERFAAPKGESDSSVDGPVLQSNNYSAIQNSVDFDRRSPEGESFVATRLRILSRANGSKISTKNIISEANDDLYYDEEPCEMETNKIQERSTNISNKESVAISNSNGENANKFDFDKPIPKRISRTNATYQESMRSRRGESEQQRMNWMHNVFKQAGLMSRVKHSAQVKVDVEDQTILE